MVNTFSKTLVDWYLKNFRNLPWRHTQNPYRIWLSEIILQQTRVSQGLPYYQKFVRKYPTVSTLAKAREEDVLKLWQGLGYYSRARNLHKAAKMVVDNFNEIFPKSYVELLKLSGVGVYTASAIASFSSNEPVAVVDGNVYRVLARIFGVFTPINSREGEKEFQKLAISLLDPTDSSTHNQAIMEFGALCCTPKKSNCVECPFIEKCYAFRNNAIDKLPVKIKKTKIVKKHFTYLIVRTSNAETYINKRVGKGIWQHLYQFPLLEASNKLSSEQIVEGFNELLSFNFNFSDLKLVKELEKPHKLSHRHICASFYECIYNGELKEEGLLKISINNLDKYPVPVLISNFVEEYGFE